MCFNNVFDRFLSGFYVKRLIFLRLILHLFLTQRKVKFLDETQINHRVICVFFSTVVV